MPIKSVLTRPKSKHAKVTSASLRIEHRSEKNIDNFTITMPKKKADPKPDASPKSHFCALAYAPASKDDKLSAAKHVILLAIEDSGVLRFLVHPNLKSIVNAIDLPYVESLLKDFLERINHYATELFRQLCTLDVGPLRAHTVGEQLCEYPNIHKLALQFSILEN